MVTYLYAVIPTAHHGPGRCPEVMFSAQVGARPARETEWEDVQGNSLHLPLSWETQASHLSSTSLYVHNRRMEMVPSAIPGSF